SLPQSEKPRWHDSRFHSPTSLISGSLERCGDVVNSDGTMPFAIASYDQSNNWLKPAGMLQAISPEHPVGMNA
ncbi:hypothetical protein V4C85_15835, partial [Ralstonia solanacearum]